LCNPCAAVERAPYLSGMAGDIQFGSVLERSRPNRLVWLLVVPVIAAILAGVYWGLSKVSAADELGSELRRSKEQLVEYQKSVEGRDQLLAKARADEALLTSAGQAMGVFYRSAPDATESGVVIANPDQHAARLYLYGLVAPPQGQEYVAVVRPRGGEAKVIGHLLADEQGQAFLLAKDLPDGLSAMEVAWVATGKPSAAEATTRVAARYPATPAERGVLIQQVVQARKGSR